MSDFSHYALYGMSGMGKSLTAKGIAAHLAANRQRMIVFNPNCEEGWPKGTLQASNADQLEALLADPVNRGAYVFVDEARTLRMTQKPHHIHIRDLGTTGRHRGHTVFAISQFVTGMDTALRWNCGRCYCFRLANVEHAKAVWLTYNQPMWNGRPAWEAILKLSRLHCFYLTNEGIKLQQVTIPKGKK